VALKTIRVAFAVVAVAVAAAASEPSAGANRECATSGTLVLTILKVKSSYLQGVEEPARRGDVPDTIQWWIGSGQIRRIATFALDHDLHVSSIGAVESDPVAFARKKNRDNYGEIIRAEHVLKFDDWTDASGVARVLKSASLPSRLKVEAGCFAFWKPDDAEYRVLSKPAPAF
jgi:hypothetical protein